MPLEKENVEAVQQMQDYIKSHINDDELSFDEMYANTCYSIRHCDRIFKRYTGKTPKEYAKYQRLSNSSKELLNSQKNVIDVALDCDFDSPEGYTKAFKSTFSVTPSKYRESPVAIPLFVEYPVKNYFALKNFKEEKSMNHQVCTVTPVEKPRRKVVLLYSKHAEDYMSFCDEKGCEWEGTFNSIPEKLCTAAFVELPHSLRKEGYSAFAAGVEVPDNYNKPLPEGCEIATLEPCTMLFFQSEPYEIEDEFCQAINLVMKAIDGYDFNAYGYEYDIDVAPMFNFGSCKETGARFAVPVRKFR